MRRRGLFILAVVAAGVVPTAAAAPCFAIGRGANTARIVIEHDDDSATFCLSFEEPAITGLDALRRTGIPIVAEEYGAGQVTLCRIGGIGCAHPTQPCFCECPGTGPCRFWGYYRAHGDQPWRFSEAGAAATIVRDGDVEGWRYGEQTPSRGGNAPRERDGVCVEDAAFLAAATTEAPAGSPFGLLAAIAGFVLFGSLIVVVNRRRRRIA